MREQLRTVRSLAVAAAALAAAGCATIGDVLAQEGLGAHAVTGEIRSVDTRRREIVVHENHGRSTRVHFDGRTEVVYDRRSYPVSVLRRGDRVTVRVSRDRRGALVADRVLVRQRTAYDGRRDDRRDEARGRATALEGRVARIDRRNDRFELRSARGANVWVSLPRRPGSALENRFRRLRQGDHVRVEGYYVDRNRFEVHRIR